MPARNSSRPAAREAGRKMRVIAFSATGASRRMGEKDGDRGASMGIAMEALLLRSGGHVHRKFNKYQ